MGLPPEQENPSAELAHPAWPLPLCPRTSQGLLLPLAVHELPTLPAALLPVLHH